MDIPIRYLYKGDFFEKYPTLEEDVVVEGEIKETFARFLVSMLKHESITNNSEDFADRIKNRLMEIGVDYMSDLTPEQRKHFSLQTRESSESLTRLCIRYGGLEFNYYTQLSLALSTKLSQINNPDQDFKEKKVLEDINELMQLVKGIKADLLGFTNNCFTELDQCLLIKERIISPEDWLQKKMA